MLAPLIAALLTFILGIGSLLYAINKINSEYSILVKSPAFIIGDGIILPVVMFIIFSQFTPTINPYLLITSLLITMAAGYIFKLLKWHWLPHGIFYLVYAYTVLSFIISNPLNLTTVTIVSLLLVHQILGTIFPKKLA